MVVTQLVVVLAVLLSGVVGAGSLRSQQGGGDVLEVVSAASSSAVAEKTFRATFAFDIDGQGLKVSTTGEMLIDVDRNVQSGSFTAPGIGKLDFVQVGTTAYMRVPGGRTAPGGQHWYGFTSPQGVESFGSQDPLEFLRLLGDADDVRKVGTEDVNGIDTTHYSVRLDPQRLAALAPQGGTSLPPGALDQFKDATADVWVDEDNLPRRMRMSMSIQSIDMRFTFDFLDYGKPVVVTAPPASDVLKVGSPAEIGALLGQGMTGS